MSKLLTGSLRVRTDYFHWLCEKSGIDKYRKSYYLLAKELHKHEFFSKIPHDENRAGDGINLRNEYAYNGSSYPEHVGLDGPCSIFEMIIGVAQRMDFLLDDMSDGREHVDRYFFDLIRNLGLEIYTDDNFVELDGRLQVDIAVTRLLYRTYDSDGRGGLFPLRHPTSDQRKVEIWYQMNAYVMEKYP